MEHVDFLAHYTLPALLPDFASDEPDNTVAHIERSSPKHHWRLAFAHRQLLLELQSKTFFLQHQLGRHLG